MLANGRIATRLPAQDLARARRFHAEKLGLEPVDERPGGLLYRCAAGEFALFASAGASPGTVTQMGREVDPGASRTLWFALRSRPAKAWRLRVAPRASSATPSRHGRRRHNAPLVVAPASRA